MRPLPLRRRALLRAAAFGVAFTVPVAVLAYLVRAEVDAVIASTSEAIQAATEYTRDHPELQQALLVWQEVFQAQVGQPRGDPGVRVGLAPARADHPRAVGVPHDHGRVGAAAGAKGLVQRARPVVEDAVAHAPGSSFPSGHATNTAAVALTLTLLVWPLLGRRGRVVVPLVAATCTMLTALDRVMLGVHYPSDVVAGIALGTALAGASYLGYSGWSATPPDQET